MRNLRWIVLLPAISIVVLFAPDSARANPDPKSTSPSEKNDVTQIIYVDGRPARHVGATLFNCETGRLLSGPIETDDNGSVKWTQVEDGKDCVRVERLAGSGSAADIIDHTAQVVPIDLTLSPLASTRVEHDLPLILCLSCVLLVAFPILQFLARPWKDRRDKLMAILEGKPLQLYYKKFRANVYITRKKWWKRSDQTSEKKPSDTGLSPENFTTAFARDFGRWYGRRYYIIPVVLLLLLTGFCARWGTLAVYGWIDGTRSIDSMSGLAAAALTGGFMWVISDEIDRLRRHDFTTSDVYYYIFRILLSIPFAWAVTRLQVTLQVGIPIAIFLGAFPTSSLLTIARRIGSQKLQLGDDPDTGMLELEKLQSIGKTNAERFKEADISNIGQLTRADPVDLAIRTNFDFDYISDCVNEALLWVYVGDEIGKLAVYSVRGACEARQLLNDYNGDDATKKSRATKTVKDIVAAFAADKILLSDESLLETLHQAGDDPYTKFLMAIWH